MGYTISTSLELPIAHCLYKGAYSGLCCGNIDVNGNQYELGDKILPIIHGHNYIITIDLTCDELDKNNMVIDFKELKEILHKHFDKFDHSMILTPDNPLTKIYEDNFKKYGINNLVSRLFIWNENPTAEYMAKRWYEELWVQLNYVRKLNVDRLVVTVEETSHNKVSYTR